MPESPDLHGSPQDNKSLGIKEIHVNQYCRLTVLWNESLGTIYCITFLEEHPTEPIYHNLPLNFTLSPANQSTEKYENAYKIAWKEVI